MLLLMFIRASHFFALRTAALLVPVDLFRVIYHGVQGTEMPSYGARIGDDNVWRMVTYIRSLTTRWLTSSVSSAICP